MTVHRHRRTRRQINRYFVGGLAIDARRHLFEQLEACPTCASYFNLHHAAEAALTADHEVSPSMLNRVEEAVVAAPATQTGRAPYFYGKVAGALVGAAVVIALVLNIYGPGAGPAPDRISLEGYGGFAPVEFTARGAQTGEAQNFGIRLFVVSRASEPPSESRALHIDDIVTFTYSRVVATDGYLTVFGLQPRGSGPLWYYPGYGEEQSLRIAGDVIDEPLGDGIQLNINHQPGPLTIIAVFTESPLSRSRFDVLAEELKASDRPLQPSIQKRLEMWGVQAVVQVVEVQLQKDRDKLHNQQEDE